MAEPAGPLCYLTLLRGTVRANQLLLDVMLHPVQGDSFAMLPGQQSATDSASGEQLQA